MFKSGSQSSSLASVGLSDYETIYEKVSKSIVMRKWIAKLNNQSVDDDDMENDHDFEVLENNDYYYSCFSKFFVSDLKSHLANCVSEEKPSEQFVDLELILIDVDEFENWKIILPAKPIPELLSEEVITTSSNVNFQDNRLSVSLNGNFKRASVRLADGDDLIKIMDVSNLRSDYFSYVRFAVKIFGVVLCFFEDSLVYMIEPQKSTFNSKSNSASKKFKIPLDRKLTTQTILDGLIRVVSNYNSAKYFDLILTNGIRFVTDIFSILGSKKIFKEFPTIIPSIEEFWNTYYYYRSKYLGGDCDDTQIQKEKEEQTKKKKYVDIDEMPEWEVPLFKYTVPKEIFKKLKKEKNWKSDSILIVSYKQLHLVISNIFEVFPDFKETHPFDYIFLKNLDRKCWFNHYHQLEIDPILKLSSYVINENSIGSIPEPLTLKNNPFIQQHIVKPVHTDFNHIRSLKPKDKAINILILDGGGIKGLNLISICEEMEKRLNKKMCEIFDLICGTSTGAILAKLFQIGLSCEECKKIYHQLGKQIFKMDGNVSVTKTLLTMKGKAWYDEKQLEMFFKKFVGIKHINNEPNRIPLWFALSTLTPLSEEIKKVVMRKHANNEAVEGVEQEFYNDLVMHAESTPFLFRSYSDPWRYPDNKKKHPDFYLGTIHGNFIHDYKALRCTSAAPLYFKEMSLGERVFVDGACVNNNPSVVSAFEAKQIWPEHSKFIFVSVGTGLKKSQENVTVAQEEELNFVDDASPKNKPKQSTGILGNVKKNLAQIYGLVDLQLSSEKQHKQMLTQVELMKESREIHYFRFNTPGLGDFDLDIVDDSTLKEWEERNKAYISELKEMEDACKILNV